ncbi:hypothetical protein MFRU_004g01190 [Monilinia fructicola]|nr:hypothetical protein MFRU_004g01190 [Monilinia fructicola]
MLALTGTTGKIGSAVLSGILENKLISPSELIICTSSNPFDPKFNTLRSQGVQIRSSNYDSPTSMVSAFTGATKLFLISTPQAHLDYNNAPYGQGREKQHFAAIDAARKAGVKQIVYASLAFGSDSKAGVMRAHLRTEEYLKGLTDIRWTILREGLYQESWPLYLGYFDTVGDERDEVVVAGNGGLSWVALRDLGVANAFLLADDTGKYDGKLFYLSPKKTATLADVLGIVSKIKGREIRLKIVGEKEYVNHYVEKGVEKEMLEWWSSSYTALDEGECEIQDGLLDELLDSAKVKQKAIGETVREMLEGRSRGK